MLLARDMPLYGTLSIKANEGVRMYINIIRILLLMSSWIMLSGLLVGCGEKALPPTPQPDQTVITITGDSV